MQMRDQINLRAAAKARHLQQTLTRIIPLSLGVFHPAPIYLIYQSADTRFQILFQHI
jgi:hypothetical protein